MERLNDSALTGKRVRVHVHIAGGSGQRDHSAAVDAGEDVQVDVDLSEMLDVHKGVFCQNSHVVQVKGERAKIRQTRERPLLHFVDLGGPDAELAHVTQSRERPGAYRSDAGARDQHLRHGADVLEGTRLDTSQLAVRHCQLIEAAHSGERSLRDGFHLSGLNLQERELREAFRESLRKAADLAAVEDQGVWVGWKVVEAVLGELVAGDERSDAAALLGTPLSPRDVTQLAEEQEEEKEEVGNCGE